MPCFYTDSEASMLLEDVSLTLQKIDNEKFHYLEDLRNINRILNEAFNCSVSLYDEQILNNDLRTGDTLVDSLLKETGCLQVFLPAKVSVGRCCSIAEFNLYSYLCKLSERYEDLYRYRKELLHKWEQVLFMILVEDVCRTITDNSANEYNVRKASAERLIRIWEHRDYTENESFSMNFITLWKSRRTIVPAFGTMLSTFELMQLSSIFSIRWHNFMKIYGKDREMLQALEEFIFGLTSCQIIKIRDYMTDERIFAIDEAEIRRILGMEISLFTTFDEDPRQMYMFYQSRDKRSKNRLLIGENGPKKTIEEMFMIYLLSET